MFYCAPGGANSSLGSILFCLYSNFPKWRPPTFLQSTVSSLLLKWSPHAFARVPISTQVNDSDMLISTQMCHIPFCAPLEGCSWARILASKGYSTSNTVENGCSPTITAEEPFPLWRKFLFLYPLLMMSTKSSDHFQWLNNTNYAKWSLHIEAVLVCAGLWGMVHPDIDHMKEDGAEKDASMIALELEAVLKVRTMMKMNKAWAVIILSLKDGQLFHCLWSNDPYTIWLVLESVHHAASFATSLALRCKFLTLKKTPSNMMQT